MGSPLRGGSSFDFAGAVGFRPEMAMGNRTKGPVVPRDNGIRCSGGEPASSRPGRHDMAEIGAWEDAEPGVRRKILQAQGCLMLMEVEFNADAAGYEHRHVHEQISYCIAGRFEYSLNGQTVLLSKGDAIYVPSNALHGAKALEPGTLIDVFTPLREDLLGRG